MLKIFFEKMLQKNLTFSKILQLPRKRLSKKLILKRRVFRHLQLSGSRTAGYRQL